MGPVQAACTVTPRKSVPLDLSGGLMLVTVAVNGVDARFILDTGAERTVIGNAAAAALKVARDEWVSTDIRGLGGRERERLGRPASISLGGIPLRRRTMAADNSVVVGTIPEQAGGAPVAGLLGQDFLSLYDLDIDPANARLTLYEVSGCVGAFLPWREPYSTIQAIRLVRNILALPVTVDGAQLHAEVDTGAQASVLLAPGLQRLRQEPGGTAVLRGFGPAAANGRMQQFNAVEIGGTTETGVSLMLANVWSLRSVDMLLGSDWLSHRHIWLSWATDQIMVEAAVPHRGTILPNH